MITVNLSEKQARELLAATGWQEPLPKHIELEIFRQLEHALMPVSTEQAENAVWMHENGYTELAIHNWKKENGVSE